MDRRWIGKSVRRIVPAGGPLQTKLFVANRYLVGAVLITILCLFLLVAKTQFGAATSTSTVAKPADRITAGNVTLPVPSIQPQCEAAFADLPKPPLAPPSRSASNDQALQSGTEHFRQDPIVSARYQRPVESPVDQQENAEVIPAIPPQVLEIPLAQTTAELQGKVQSQDGLVTLNVKSAPLHSVLSLIAQQQGLSIASPTALDAQVTISLQPTSLENALDAIMAVSGCTWSRYNDVIYVTQLKKDATDSFLMQGRIIQVFDLNYMSAQDVEKMVTAFLSPVGKVFARSLKKEDQRFTVEQLIVEDLPEYVHRIAEFVARSDQPPRQVMVEVRVLQIKLKNDQRHGVNLDAMVSSDRPEVWFRTKAFVTGTGPAATFSVNGTRFDQLMDLLSSTEDSKTLAAPKLMMVNGQESKIQIGQRLAYTTSTTTQTVTVQGVQFLDVGVVLTVTPHIADDGQILMKVQPKVSSGQINPNSELPEEDTTELSTSVMVPDGSGIIIGGLIQETSIERQSKLPWIGDVWLIGRLFQRRSIDRERAEVIVALLPKIVPVGSCGCIEDSMEMQRTLLPILTPDVRPATRPEPSLNDAINKPVRSMRGILK